MKIAILAPPWIAIPPQGYGGIELVVANLTEGLVKRGHDVILHATGDSKTSARLQYFYEKAVGNNLELKNSTFVVLPHLHDFFKKIKKEKVDIIHNNCQYEPMYFLDLQSTPFIHTLHGAFYQGLRSPTGQNEEKRKILLRFKDHPFVSISDNQRLGIPELNYTKTVYNGIRPEDFSLGSGKGDYLAYLGRITPNKGVDVAINVAKKLKMKLKIAAFVDRGDMAYFKEKILPLSDENVDFVGEVKTTQEKNAFLGASKAALFPIAWHEPFGLVMVEAMATGTPVIAFNKGSVPEIIVDGKTGFVVENEEQMAASVGKIGALDRTKIREHAISNFSVARMVEGYELAYSDVIGRVRPSLRV